MEPGKLVLHITKQRVSPNFTTQIAHLLSQWTHQPWSVTLSAETGMPTLHEQDYALDPQPHETILHHPIVKTILDVFPGACIVDQHRTSSQESSLDQISNDATISKDYK